MNFIKENIWTWAGTGLALITLSGVTQTKGLVIAGGAILIQCALALLTTEE